MRWVAGGRPSSGPGHESLEACFAELTEKGPNRSEDLDRYTDLLDQYQTGWRALPGEQWFRAADHNGRHAGRPLVRRLALPVYRPAQRRSKSPA